MPCKRCGSFAINHNHHGRDGTDAELCDVCYWRNRYSELEARIAEADARLIAAAPDLLGVARSVMMMKRLGGMLPGVKEIIDSVVADAEEAIKKVEGPQ